MSEAPRSWQDRIVGSGMMAPDQFLANPGNFRIHSAMQEEALEEVLDRVGWVRRVLVNRTTGHVLDGHLRVALAIRRDEPEIPFEEVELSEEEERLVLAALDPIAGMAGTDAAKLAELLDGLDLHQDGSLLKMLTELQATSAPAPTRTPVDEDEVPERRATTIQRGDLFQLGRHRLLCGDSTSAEDVGRVLGGATPRLMITDPPYGVEYDAAWRIRQLGNTNNAVGAVSNDDRCDWLPVWENSPSDVAYVWHASLHAGEVQRSLEAATFEMRNQIIWSKPSIVIGRGHYHWQHEPCWYAVRRGATAEWAGDRKQSTVWNDLPSMRGGSAVGDDEKNEHSTQKPVEAMARPMRNHEGDVFDPFGGSGTTLIAAERLGRTCYAIEIDPSYVQLIIDRWESVTGEKAVKIEDTDG